MPHKGCFRYDAPMHIRVGVRMTNTQVQSLSAMSHAMSLTVGDTIRAAIDQFFEDVEEEEFFSRLRLVIFPP